MATGQMFSEPWDDAWTKFLDKHRDTSVVLKDIDTYHKIKCVFVDGFVLGEESLDEDK